MPGRMVLFNAAAFVAFALCQTASAGTLDDVIARDTLKCGVNQGLPGFAFVDVTGRRAGLDADTCRAVAAAVLGDADRVTFVPLSPKERFTTLQTGVVDLLIQNTTWTLLRDTALELDFAGVNFYDGQGFLVQRELELTSALELDGALVCVPFATTTEINLVDYFRKNDLDLRTSTFETAKDAAAAYEAGLCDALTYDLSGLVSYRSHFENPSDHVLLPEIISKEPLGPVVRHGDNQWSDVVRWTLFALIQAEESGVTSANVDDMKLSNDPTIQRLLGVNGHLGRHLGLSNHWAETIIRQVGNYGEIYDRNVGPDTPIGLDRGLNALWRDGGLHYAMPFH